MSILLYKLYKVTLYYRENSVYDSDILIEGSNIEKCFKSPPPGAAKPYLQPQGKNIIFEKINFT